MDPGGDRGVGGRLISLAEAAAARGRWLETLDLASQVLADDPTQTTAAELVGTARRRLGSVTSAAAELRHITVVAVDMHGSTAIAARMGPELMRELMLELYEACAEAVARYEGRVTKYLGDGVLAQFGYPVVHEDDARRAVLASLAVIDAVGDLSGRWEPRLGEPVAVRIGIDSGVAAVGPMDASPWAGEEIAGDPPNIASRVQATADRMTVRITDATHELIRGWFETLPVGPVDLRNYPDPVFLHRVLGPTGAETRLEAHREGGPPLIGYADELAALRAALRDVTTRRERRVVALTGEAGIGKSRILKHLVATSVASGAAYVSFACSRLYRDSALRPVARAFQRFFRTRPGSGDALVLDAIRRQLEQLPGRRLPAEEVVPLYGWLLGVRSAVDLEPDELRRRLFDAVVDLLEAIARNSTLVLAVDDADVADPSTAELLRMLLARPPEPILVLMTGRGDPPELPGESQRLELTGLAEADAASLVRAVAPRLEEARVERIVAASGGVPYLLEEQARAAADEVGTGARVPTELSVFLAARLDELGSGHRRLLAAIAVAGEQVRVEALPALTGFEAHEVDTQLAELARRRLIVRQSGPHGDSARFRHGLMRDAAYEGMLASERVKLHRRAADFLAALEPGSAPPEDLARHLELADDHSNAARLWLAAGDAAVVAGANAEAAKLFRRGLAALGRVPGEGQADDVELGLQLGLGTVLSTLEGYTSAAARAAFERAVVVGERLADTTTIFPALWGVWSYWFTLGEHRVASTLADRCLRIAEEQAADRRFRCEAGAIAGYQRLHLGDFEDARRELELAAGHSGVEPAAVFPHDPGIVSRSALAVALWFLGDEAASRAAAGEALERAEAMDPANRRTALTEAWVACTLAWRAELDGDPERAIELAERAAAIAARRGYATWLAAATLHRSIALCTLGRRDEGLPVLAATVDAWRAAGRDAAGRALHRVLMTPYFAGRLAEAWLAAGDAERARAELEELLAATSENGERFWDVELLRLRAAAAGDGEGDLATARALAAEQGARALAARLPGGVEARTR